MLRCDALQAIETSERSSVLSERVRSVTEQMRRLVFEYVARSLAENDKLVFAFLLAAQVELQRGNLSETEWRLVITGTAALREQGAAPAGAGQAGKAGRDEAAAKPPAQQPVELKSPEWLPDKLWSDLSRLTQVGSPWAELPGSVSQQVGLSSLYQLLGCCIFMCNT